jgi:SAM-dependent methyltransferase
MSQPTPQPDRSSTPSASGTGPQGAPPGRPGKAADFAAKRDWPAYFRAVLGKPARETLLKALELFEREAAADARGAAVVRTAIDLGCGEGRDTLELLRRGWRVTALDGHAQGIDLLLERVPAQERARVDARVQTFEALAAGTAGAGPAWGAWDAPGGYDLVNASFSLPFCPPAAFAPVWARVRSAIRPGGRFAGQLFGDRDSWAVIADRTHHRRSELDGLFEGFVLEELREDEKLDTDCAGTPKHWHVYHVVARKR